MTVNEIREFIKDRLAASFTAANKYPQIYTTSLPISQEANEELEKEAKARGDNGVVYIGRGTRIYSQVHKIRSLFELQDPYYIIIYNNNKSDDTKINELFDIARSCLGTFMNLEADFVADLKGYKSGLYMAWIRALWVQNPVYQAMG